MRLFLAFPALVPITIFSINLLQGTREIIPVTLIISLSIGLAITPFTLRTTLATGQVNSAIQAIRLGLFSALAWTFLACSYLGFVGIGQPTFNADLGRMLMNDPPDPTLPLAALLILLITVSGLVMTGDGIRQAATKPSA